MKIGNFLKSLQVAGIIGAFFCSMVMPPEAFATDGNLNTTNATTTGSTGTIAISITKPVGIDITGLSDMTVSNWNVTEAVPSLSSTACIYSTSQSYKVTATGSGYGSGAHAADFVIGDLTNDGTVRHTAPYTVFWNGQGAGNLGSAGTDQLTSGTASSTYTTANSDSITCAINNNTSGITATGPNARVDVVFTSTNLEEIDSGTFSGTLSLQVAVQ